MKRLLKEVATSMSCLMPMATGTFMKKFIATLTIALAMMLVFPLHSNAENSDRSGDSTRTGAITDASILLKRLDRIDATDKKNLNAAEKKHLRKESRSIKGKLKELHGARYIPAGAIVILLIIPFAVYQIRE